MDGLRRREGGKEEGREGERRKGERGEGRREEGKEEGGWRYGSGVLRTCMHSPGRAVCGTVQEAVSLCGSSLSHYCHSQET